MTKGSLYVCQQCGYSQVGWGGKCPNCGAWGSLVETLATTGSKSKSGSTKYRGSQKTPLPLSSVPSKTTGRIKTTIPELDRVLGGGFVAGQVVLLAGEPGIGKSTILLQAAEKFSQTLYVSGEESATQVRIRADRLGIKTKDILFLEETDVDSIIASLDGMATSPPFVIIDSIQTMATGDLSGMAGSVGQVRECAARLLSWAKAHHVPCVLVGHVTKQGTVAGPSVLAHIVDSVLWFEGDRDANVRLLRAIKNRFGPTDEVGIFTMEEKGLISVSDASKLFLFETSENSAGSVVTSILQGTRPLLIEVQALTVSTKLAIPRRVTQGIDARRVELIVAVLTRRCGLKLLDMDVYINIAGGVSVREPASDLAVALSIASSYFDKPVPKTLMAVGEVGLMGEIRAVSQQDKRITEARRQGYKLFATSNEFAYLSQLIRKFFLK